MAGDSIVNGDINLIISRRPAEQAVVVILWREFPALRKETVFDWTSDQTHICIPVTHFNCDLFQNDLLRGLLNQTPLNLQ